MLRSRRWKYIATSLASMMALILPTPVGLDSGPVSASCSTSAWIGRYVYTPTFDTNRYRSNSWLNAEPRRLLLWTGVEDLCANQGLWFLGMQLAHQRR
jgi:hypothetical protein